MSERWKSIPGLVNLEWGYEASNLGRIRNVYTGNVRKPQLNHDGRYVVALWLGKKLKTFYIHRLVALAWCEGYSDGMVVVHRNENYTDNRPGNLRWATASENFQEKIRQGAFPLGNKRPNAKLHENAVKEIRKRVRAGEKQKTLAREYGVSPRAIAQVIERISWKHVEDSI